MIWRGQGTTEKARLRLPKRQACWSLSALVSLRYWRKGGKAGRELLRGLIELMGYHGWLLAVPEDTAAATGAGRPPPLRPPLIAMQYHGMAGCERWYSFSSVCVPSP